MDESIPYEKPPPYSPTAELLFPAGAQNINQQSGNPPYPTQPPPYPPQGAPNTYQQYGYPPYPQPQPTVYPIPGSTPLVNTSVYPPPTYGGTTVTINPRQIQNPEIIIVGGCPICRVGVLEDEYPCIGIMCAIVFFPLGILCCLAMREKRCSNCGVQLG